MKYLWIISIYVFLFFTACSYSVSISERMRILSDKIEQNGESLTEEQLTAYELQYKQLLEELEQNIGIIEPEELNLAAKEIARYNGLQARYNFNTTVESLKLIYQLLPSAAEGFLEGFNIGNDVKGLEEEFESMLDEAIKAGEKLKLNESTLTEIQQSIERVVENASEEFENLINK